MKKQFIFIFTILICSIFQYKGIAKNTVHEAILENHPNGNYYLPTAK